jgi:5'-3' exoribonuclease 2
MASDLSNLDRYKLHFDLSQPFTPMGQLMGVLPAKSAHALPESCAELMMNPLSPIIDFYPENFALDLNGKKALWQAVALLPWIEEKRLLAELGKITPTFTPEEQDRNSLGVDYLFVHKENLLANSIYALYNQFPLDTLKDKTPLQCSSLTQVPLDPVESLGMNGFISPYVQLGPLDGRLKSEVGLHPVEDIAVMSVIFTDPPHRPHICALLPGLIPPKAILTNADFEESARGGAQQRDNNQSRNNQQRHNNQRDSQRQWQGGMSHGGQAPGADPRFGAAPSHFQQNAPSERIWSSGFNQRQPGERRPPPPPQQQQPAPFQHQQQRGGWQGQQQQGGYQGHQQGGYPQQQQQHGYPQQHQVYQHHQQPYQHQQQPYHQGPSSFPPPAAAPYSFNRGPAPPQPPNHLAALQAQIQASTAAQRAQHMQRGAHQPSLPRRY